MIGEKITAGEYVYLHIMKNIREGIYKPNEKIPSENELAEIYKCSRNTVRSALNRLSALGFVKTYKGKGTFVKEPEFTARIETLLPQLFSGSNDYLSIMLLWVAVESESAGLASQRMTYSQIAKLEALVLDMEEHRDDLEYYSKKDAEFHAVIAEASGNGLLINLIKMVRAILNDVMDDFIKEFGNYESIESHRNILYQIKIMDSENAHMQMRRHTYSAITRYLNMDRRKQY